MSDSKLVCGPSNAEKHLLLFESADVEKLSIWPFNRFLLTGRASLLISTSSVSGERGFGLLADKDAS